MNKRNPMNQFITQYRTHGITILETLDECTLSSILSAANTAYYNRDPLMTDNEYDIVREFVENKYPSAQILTQIGAPVTGKQKVKLPYEMPSMDKIKPDTNALQTWKTEYKGPYVLSCKLDGVSGLFINESLKMYTKGHKLYTKGHKLYTKGHKLYTRGNGTIGQDISHFIPHLKLPIHHRDDFAVRGEFILRKSTFETKYASEFANSRNLVSGIINSKTPDQKIDDVQFVAYEIVHPPMKPSEQMTALRNWGFTVVQHSISENVDNGGLSKTLLDWRAHYEYDIDGIIVANDAIYDRKPGNPKHAFAFKMVISDQIA
jgi:NAD-dependent DNA ligase